MFLGMGHACGPCGRSRIEKAAICVVSKGLQPFLKLNAPPFPAPLGSLCDSRWVVVSIVEEPVSTRVGWTNIYTLLAGGMKPAICPAWSATTWKQTNGAMCPLCHSLWQLTQEQCTMGKSTFQASPPPTSCCQVQFPGTFLTGVYVFNSQGEYTMENTSRGYIAMTL